MTNKNILMHTTMVAPQRKLIAPLAHRMRLARYFNSLSLLIVLTAASGESNQRTRSTILAKRAVSAFKMVPIPTIRNTGVNAC